MASFGVGTSVLDACVLYPLYLRDTLLRIAEQNLYQPVWSADILAETRRALLVHGRMDEVGAHKLLAAMRGAFPEAEVAGYDHLIPSLKNNAGDRHVLAVAIHAKADVIVTENLRHFPKSALSPHGIVAQSADTFLVERLDDAPRRVAQVLIEQAADCVAPPLGVIELLDRLAKQAPRFVGAARVILGL